MSQKKEELQIRDLLVKLQVITHGFIEERKKSQEFLSRLKNHEQSLKQKESENIVLTKANIDLQTKLSLETLKKAPKKVTSNFVAELEEKSFKQEEEIKILSQRVSEKDETIDQLNIKLQTMIVVKDDEINKLKKDLEEEKEKLKTFQEDKTIINNKNEEKINEITKKYDMEKDEMLKNIEK